MTNKQLARFRRAEIRGLTELLGLDRVAPGAKADFRRRIARIQRQLRRITA